MLLHITPTHIDLPYKLYYKLSMGSKSNLVIGPTFCGAQYLDIDCSIINAHDHASHFIFKIIYTTSFLHSKFTILQFKTQTLTN